MLSLNEQEVDHRGNTVYLDIHSLHFYGLAFKLVAIQLFEGYKPNWTSFIAWIENVLLDLTKLNSLYPITR